MNPNPRSRTSAGRRSKGLVWLATGAASLGLGIGAASIVSAASDSGSSSTGSAVVSTVDTVSTSDSVNTSDTPPAAPTGDAPTAPPAGNVDPASLPNGPGETVLTGDALAKVTAAVEAAEPGATVIRAETDSSGHAYEAHVTLADGTVKTLYFTDTFAADGSDDGFGPRQPGDHPQGPPPAGQAPAAGDAGTGA